LRLTALLLLTLLCASCTGPVNGSTSNPRLLALPAANPAIYKKVDLKAWKNPYVIVRTDGVGLLDVTNNEEHLMKSDELTDALAQLPEAQREAVTLRHLHGLPLAAIADRLGRGPAATAGLLKRGLARLRELLTDTDP